MIMQKTRQSYSEIKMIEINRLFIG